MFQRTSARMSRPLLALAMASAVGASAQAAVLVFDDDPFAGTTALTTPGRQIVGAEAFVTFDPAADSILIDSDIFGIEDEIIAFNGTVELMPDTRFNLVVLRNLDADFDPSNGVLMNAGLAASLIAGRLSTPGPGFFVYFNSGLDLPRLVFSTDLADETADLKVVARFTNLAANPGSLEDIGPQVAVVPEPGVWGLMILGFGWAGSVLRRARGREPLTA